MADQMTPPDQDEFDWAMTLRKEIAKRKSGDETGPGMNLFEMGLQASDEWPDRSVISDYTPYEVISHVLEHRGWDERDGQLDMVDLIATGDNLVISAPVGIGKTLGYLIPCLLNYSQFMVATSTKALQDQIANQEMPRLADDLDSIYGFRPVWTVLKGKSNYLDENRFDQLLSLSPLELQSMGWTDEHDTKVREEIKRLEAMDDNGTGAGFDSEGLQADLGYNIWRHLCATTSKSKWFRKTLERAYGHSQVIITNSAYVVSVSQIGMASYPYIGFPQAVIFDEAHHLPDIVTESMSCEFDPAAAGAVGEGLKNIAKNIGPNTADAFNNLLDELSEAADKMMWVNDDTDGRNDIMDMAILLHKRINTMADAAINEASDITGGISMELTAEFTDLSAGDHPYTMRCAKDKFLSLTALMEYCTELGFMKLHDAALSQVKDSDGNNAFAFHMSVDERESTSGARRRVFKKAGFAPIYTQRFGEAVHESFTDTGLLNAVNMEILKEAKNEEITDVSMIPYIQPQPWMPQFPTTSRQVVLASGTISDGVQVPLGLTDSEYKKMSSPFNPARCRVYIPSNMTPPTRGNERDWMREATTEACEMIAETGGRALILTSSYKNLNEFKDRILSNFPGHTILSQGDADKHVLIERFREDEHSILIGTKGFWEGVDVPGPACSLVIIDKIPFPFPSAVIKAREEYIAQTRGQRQVFMGVSVLDASQMIAQGAGRLIRSEGDIGGVAILDSRLSSARYGSAVISLLNPGTKYTTSFDEFKSWLHSVNPDNPGSPEEHEFNDRLWASAVPERRKRRNFG